MARSKILVLTLLEDEKKTFIDVLGNDYDVIFLDSLKEFNRLFNRSISILFVSQSIKCINEIIDIYKKKDLAIPKIGIIDYNHMIETDFFDDFLLTPINPSLLLYRVKIYIKKYDDFELTKNELLIANNRQMESVFDSMVSLIAIYNVDITNDLIVSRTNNEGIKYLNDVDIDSQIKKSEEFILDDVERKIFQRKFNRNNLIEEYNRGNKTVSMNMYVTIDENVKLVTCSIAMYENNGIIEGLFKFYDITESQNFQKINDLLLSNKYLGIGILDLESKIINMVFYKGRRANLYYHYDEINDSRINNLIALEDKEKYLEKSSIENIIRSLEIYKQYFFTVKIYKEDGDFDYIQFEYSYFDKDNKKILCLRTNVTDNIERDILTGRLNRRGFLHQANNIFKNFEPDKYSVLYFNFRKFKAVNELFGLDYGNTLLRDFAKNLEKSGMKPLYLARIEADHFACIVKTNDLDFDSLNDLMHFEFTLNNKSIKMHMRLGVYIVNEILDTAQMLDRAKLAKKFIKDESVKPYAIYDDTMKNSYILKAISQFDLEKAIENDEFKVYYQPVVDCKTGKIASAEALIRWQHDTLGLVPPCDFLPALEESGDISKIDLFVMERIIKLYNKRKELKKTFVPVSSNLSRMDLFDETMMNSIISGLRVNNEIKNFLRIEITETICVNIEGRAKSLLNELRSLGAKMYIDDFGSGYSSLSTISDFDFDFLKLDMSFIKKIDNDEKVKNVIKAIINLAHSLDLKVVAEGVEKASQYSFLKSVKCDYIQGYFFSKPLCEEEYEKLLDRQIA